MDVARERSDDMVLSVQHDVQDEGEARHFGGGHHVVVHAVALDDARSRPRVVHELPVVVVHDGLVGGHARQHRLARPREAGEEMRLDEALGEQQVGFGGDTVDDALAAGGQGPDCDHRLVVGGDVHHDLLFGDDAFAILVHELLMCGRTVHAGRHEDAHMRLGCRRVNATQQDGHRHA